MIMKIKIQAVDGISLQQQLLIVNDYISIENNGYEPRTTKRNIGTKIESLNRRYHVSCQRAKTTWVFTIWWAV